MWFIIYTQPPPHPTPHPHPTPKKAAIQFQGINTEHTCVTIWEQDKADRERGGKATSRNSQSPGGQWRTEKNGGNWLYSHLWCLNDPCSKGIDNNDDDEITNPHARIGEASRNCTRLLFYSIKTSPKHVPHVGPHKLYIVRTLSPKQIPQAHALGLGTL